MLRTEEGLELEMVTLAAAQETSEGGFNDPVIQERDDGGLDQCYSRRDNEKYSDSGYILKVTLKGF